MKSKVSKSYISIKNEINLTHPPKCKFVFFNYHDAQMSSISSYISPNIKNFNHNHGICEDIVLQHLAKYMGCKNIYYHIDYVLDRKYYYGV
uniref:Uncharacterized protein n=1 Tax=viral metagenome TaxID=1070528 RepID=A0A6C0CMZ9_9ZZZZ